MAGEVNEVVEQPTEQETQDEQQALAEFNAGFEDAPPAPDQTETPEAATQEEEPKPTEEPAAPAEPSYVQITQQQLDDLMAGVGAGREAREQLSKAFGSIGQMKQAVDQLRAQTAPGQKVEITEEDMADLAEEFPEMTTAALKTFQKVASKLRGTGAGADPVLIERVVSDRTEQIRTELLNSRLDEIVDGNWQDETKTEPFKAWFNAQGDDIKAKGASDSPRDAAHVLRAWVKAKNAPPPPPPPAPAAPAAPALSPRQRQLAAAVNPRSIGGAPAAKTPEDEFNEGFRSASS